MLTWLRIRDLAIIDHVQIELHAGLNILTGETGAGKSIIVGALDLLVGARASSDLVRAGAESAEVEGVFEQVPEHLVRALTEQDLLDPDEPGTVVVRRVIGAQGRSRAFINGRLVNQANLREATLPLIDMTSQHAQYALLDPNTHLGLLDQFAGISALRVDYGAMYSRYTGQIAERDALLRAQRERAEREDYLRFQAQELEAAKLSLGEDEALEAELRRLRHAAKLRAGALAVEDTLGRRASGVLAQLSDCGRKLSELGGFDERLRPLAARVDSARIELEDVSFEVGRYLGGLDEDPRQLDTLEERLAAIRHILRKHGPTIADAIAKQRTIASELEQLTQAAGRTQELDAAIAAAERELRARAEVLSAARAKAAVGLGERVIAELADLAMPHAQFRAALSAEGSPPKLGPAGIDRCEFEVSTNRGEAFRSLLRSASGGELSRILLAIKSVLLACDPVPTSVFDEVDTGVGGAVAEIIGRKLARAAEGAQVICITHLPQIAAFAAHHLMVRKEQLEDRTVTRVSVLSADEQLAEVARMLGGVTITERTREHAREMIRHARSIPD